MADITATRARVPRAKGGFVLPTTAPGPFATRAVTPGHVSSRPDSGERRTGAIVPGDSAESGEAGRSPSVPSRSPARVPTGGIAVELPDKSPMTEASRSVHTHGHRDRGASDNRPGRGDARRPHRVAERPSRTEERRHASERLESRRRSGTRPGEPGSEAVVDESAPDEGRRPSPWSRMAAMAEEDRRSDGSGDGAGTGPAARWMDAFDSYNASIGGALTQLDEQPQDIQGRDKEIGLLVEMLERPITPVVLLLGLAGSGKTALVEEFVKRANSGRIDSAVAHSYMPVALRLGRLSALDNNDKQAALATILGRLAEFERDAREVLDDRTMRLVLFIDEVHMVISIFGEGTKIGGDVMKDMLARTPIPVIAATTRREYDSSIAVDKPLAERFKVIEMQEVGPEVVEAIAADWWSKVAPDCPPIDPEVVRTTISYNATYRPDSAEPRKTLDTMEDLVSYCRRTGEAASVPALNDVFRKRFSIDTEFRIDHEAVFAEIERRIIGQPAALNRLHLLLAATAFKVRQNSDRPVFTALFTGSTGTGKTETTKAIADTVYPGQNVLFFLNGGDFQLPESEPMLRKELGERIQHQPNSVVLFDEVDKMSDLAKRTFLSILDEGLVNFTVTNREGRPEVNTASLRNAIVICTTNAGADVFEDDQRYNRGSNADRSSIKGQDRLDYIERAQIDRLMENLRDNLIKNGWPPELLGRFDQIVPFRALTERASLEILQRSLDKMLSEIRDVRGIDVRVREPVTWDSRQYGCVASDVVVFIAFEKAKIRDSNSGGARALRHELETGVFYALVRAVLDHPGCRVFDMSVKGAREVTEGGETFWRMDHEGVGRVLVEPNFEASDALEEA